MRRLQNKLEWRTHRAPDRVKSSFFTNLQGVDEHSYYWTLVTFPSPWLALMPTYGNTVRLVYDPPVAVLRKGFVSTSTPSFVEAFERDFL